MIKEETTKRIGYIDALRGMAMILVVYFHISAYGFRSYVMVYNDIIERFRMPLFFFISGWLFKYIGRTTKEIIKQKFMVQIVPTAFFMLLYLCVFDYLSFDSFGSDKKGYWFTYVLFEFFVVYLGLKALFNRHNTKKGEIYMMLAMLFLSISALYYSKYYTRYAEELGIWKTILGLFSFVKFKHIIFFWFGTFVKKHFDQFIQLTNKPLIIGSLLGLFVVLNIYPVVFSITGLEYIAFLIVGFSGVIVIFTLFRHLYTPHQTSNLKPQTLNLEPFSSFFHHSSSILKFVGTRTLDIYLIHYFFLPYHIEYLADSLNLQGNSFLCMLVSLPLAIGVMALSLVVSYLIRLSPFLGKHLLGAKNE